MNRAATNGGPANRQSVCLLLRPAASDFQFLTLVLDGADGAENLGAELAVRFADDLHRVLVVDDIACLRIDRDLAAWPACRPVLDLVHEGIGVEFAVEFLDSVE